MNERLCVCERYFFEQMLFNEASRVQLWIPSLFLNADADGSIIDNFFIFLNCFIIILFIWLIKILEFITNTIIPINIQCIKFFKQNQIFVRTTYNYSDKI